MFFENLIMDELESDSFLEGFLDDVNDDLCIGVLEADATNDTPGEEADEEINDDDDTIASAESGNLFDF